ncbi:MAG: YtxH domain-containing protein [Anaerolineales bacterium]
MRKIFAFLIGVLLGGLVGSTIALLLAPASGEQLRAQLRQRAQSVVTEVRQAAQQRRIELEQRLQELRAPRA